MYYASELAFLAGQREEARKGFTEYSQFSTKPAAGFFRLACLEQDAKNWSTATAYVLKAIQADPTVREYSLKHAELLLAQSQYEAAADKYAALIDLNPRYYSLYRDAIRYYRTAGNTTKALALSQKMETNFGFVEEVALSRIDLLKLSHQPEQVISTYQRLIEKYPERRTYIKSLIDYYRSVGKGSEAEALEEKLFAASSPYYQQWKACQTLVKSKNWSAWRTAFKDLVDIPGLGYAEKYAVLPTLEQADSTTPSLADSILQSFVELQNKYPGEQKLGLMLGNYYVKHYQFLPASVMLQKTVNNAPADLAAWEQYFTCLDWLHNGVEMASAADTFLQLYPVLNQGYYWLAKGQYFMGAYDKSLENIGSGIGFATSAEDKNKFLALQAAISIAQGKSETTAQIINSWKNAESIGYQNVEQQIIWNLGKNNCVATESDILQMPLTQNLRREVMQIIVDLHCNRLPKAFQGIETLLKSYPNFAMGYFLEAKFFEKSGNTTAANAALKKAQNLGFQWKQATLNNLL